MKTFKQYLDEVNVDLLRKARANRAYIRNSSTKTENNPAIKHYTGSGYKDVNHKLRTGEKLPDTLNIVARMKKAKEDFTVWRGTDHDQETEKGENKLSGMVSTSLKPKKAAFFGKNIMKIRVPKGTPFIHSKRQKEDEVILPPGTFHKTKETTAKGPPDSPFHGSYFDPKNSIYLDPRSRTFHHGTFKAKK